MPETPSAKSTSLLVSSTIREHTAPLTERTEAIASASKSLARQEKVLLQDTQKLSRQAEELEKTIDESVDQLKELGDLQNWAEVVFRDISIIEDTLRMVENQEREHDESGDGTGTRPT